jgi:two-component system, OmpR family, phosphate regulon sensor histidine kinase PhoR
MISLDPLVELLMQTVNEWIFLLDQDLKVLRAGQAGLEALGYSPEEVIGKEWKLLCPPSTELEQELLNLRPGAEPVYRTVHLKHFQNHPVPVVAGFFPLNSAQREARVLIVGFDLEESQDFQEDALQLAGRVTQLQESFTSVNRMLGQTALQLAEEQQKMLAVMAGLGQGLLVLDPTGRILQCGGTTEKILDRGRENLLGRSVQQVLPGLVQLLQSGPGPLSDEPLKDLRFEHRGKLLRANAAPIIDSEKRALGSVITFEDFTRLAEIDRLKSELISIVSHEIRTPLSSIKGYVELLLDEETPTDEETYREHLQVVQANAERLMDLVDVMLDIERIDSGRLQMNFETVDLAYAGHYVRSTFRQAADEKNIQLEMDVPEGLTVRADLDRLIQALSNLVSNGIKYTPEGGKVSLRAMSENATVHIEVEDTGMGIDPRDQERLFERFYRVASSARKIKGSGLGLSITKSIIEAHGGQIEVESHPSRGSRFSIRLPSEEENPIM